MRINPVDQCNYLPHTNNRDGLAARSEHPVPPEGIKERTNHLPKLQNPDSYFVDRNALEARVLIIEGISGSGKDTFQTYLKKKLKSRHLYDYSEGEVLHSWKHLKIDGILKLRVKFMQHFANYISDIIRQDESAVFLLNRFHLSTYVSTIIQQPKLEKDYDKIINVLRTLPVHIFVLQLDENEIETRSLHPERSGAWQKHQQQIVKKEGFRNRLERYLWQQGLILEVARRQTIPFSIIRVPVCAGERGGRWIRGSEAQSIFGF